MFLICTILLIFIKKSRTMRETYMTRSDVYVRKVFFPIVGCNLFSRGWYHVVTRGWYHAVTRGCNHAVTPANSREKPGKQKHTQ